MAARADLRKRLNVTKEDRRRIHTEQATERLAHAGQRMEERRRKEEEEAQQAREPALHPLWAAWVRHHPDDRERIQATFGSTTTAAAQHSTSVSPAQSMPSSLPEDNTPIVPVPVEEGDDQPPSTADDLKRTLPPPPSTAPKQKKRKEMKAQREKKEVFPQKLTVDRTRPEWIRLWQRVLANENVLYEGCSQTGKSVVATTVAHALHATHPSKKVAFCTGGSRVVAQHLAPFVPSTCVGGIRTFLELAGALAVAPAPIDPTHTETARELSHIDVLIVDDIHEVDPDLWQLVDDVARFVRKAPKQVLGGIQVIGFADFAHGCAATVLARHPFYVVHCFAKPIVRFRHSAVHLKVMETPRRHDHEWFYYLDFLRKGRSQPCIDAVCLNAAVRTPNANKQFVVDIVPDRYPGGSKEGGGAATVNAERVAALTSTGAVRVFKSHEFIRVTAKATAAERTELCLAMSVLVVASSVPSHLTLTIGSQVMLVEDVPSVALCAGRIGKVRKFALDHGYPVIEWGRSGYETQDALPIRPFTWSKHYPMGSCVRVHLPLVLSWAVPLSLVQGLSLPENVLVRFSMDFSKLDPAERAGLAYSLLTTSRCSSDCIILDWSPQCVQTLPILLQLCGLKKKEESPSSLSGSTSSLSALSFSAASATCPSSSSSSFVCV